MNPFAIFSTGISRPLSVLRRAAAPRKMNSTSCSIRPSPKIANWRFRCWAGRISPPTPAPIRADGSPRRPSRSRLGAGADRLARDAETLKRIAERPTTWDEVAHVLAKYKEQFDAIEPLLKLSNLVEGLARRAEKTEDVEEYEQIQDAIIAGMEALRRGCRESGISSA